MPQLILAADPLGILMTALGLGGLIFFHELGHFLACRVTGTRVEAFAIGFGPQIFGWRRGGTVYKLCAIPLGGYVKMAAENPGEQNTGAPDEFPNKSYSQRLLIMSAGVIFNAILAMFLFAWAFGIGVPFANPKIGTAPVGGAGWQAGLQQGDVVLAVNGQQILSFEDLRMEVVLSAKDETLVLTIDRDGKKLEVPVVPEYSELNGMPSMGVGAPFELHASGVVADSPIAKAGGRMGDQVVRVGNTPLTDPSEIDAEFLRLAGAAPTNTKTLTVPLTVRREDGTEEVLTVEVPIQDARPQIGVTPYFGREITKLRRGTSAAELLRVGDRILSIDGWAFEAARTYRELVAIPRDAAPARTVEITRGGKKQVVSLDMTEQEFAQSFYVGAWEGDHTRVVPSAGRPAEKAGVRVGDTVLAVGKTEVSTWSEMNKAILANGMKPVEIKVKHRGGETETLTIEPAGRASFFAIGYDFKMESGIAKESNFFAALGIGFDRTVRSLQQVVLTIKGLVTQRVSSRMVGGPIKIVQVTYGVFAQGWGKYLYILALISMNLAVLNLLPIPVLDGGQIVLLTAEKIRGAPLPDKVVGYFQMVGLVLLLALIALALTNDITDLLR